MQCDNLRVGQGSDHDGLVQVTLKAVGSGNQQHMGKDSPWNKDGVMDLLVTENVFYHQAVDRVYDLKGSERSRYASDDPSDAGAVLLDANLRESNLSAPILVSAWWMVGIAEAVHADRGS